MIPRFYTSRLDDLLKPGKVLVLYGPRQVGKTTLVRHYLGSTRMRYRFETGDDAHFRHQMESQSLAVLRELGAGVELLVIDEAQRIEDVGHSLKLLCDHVPDLRILATGSASFDLANKTGEPLTGRRVTRVLFPVGQLELQERDADFDLKRDLPTRLLYGSYPEVVEQKNDSERVELLKELFGAYLLKDILELERVKSSRVLFDLLKLLAWQIGHDVSHSELGTQLGIDAKTVARYIDLLEKVFVIRSVAGFSRNLRKEVAKSRRYYFVDNGIRNMAIQNFNAIDMRDDVGALWENFVAMERSKRNEYLRHHANVYFWRTYDQQEIDLLEEAGGTLAAYELKWNPAKATTRPPRAFAKAYPSSTFEVIHPENYLSFVR